MSDWTTFTNPALLRIAVTTTATSDIEASEAAYVDWLGYRVIERGKVEETAARAWGCPAAAGAPFRVLAAEGEQDVFIRLVETPVVPGYRPLTTFGWNAFEIIVEDVPALFERLCGGPFEVIGPPRPLQFMPSIVAMQVCGPAGECLYFTMESGDRSASILPEPSAFVGRTFIVVAGGPDFQALLRWYVDLFDLRERPVRHSKVQVLQHAQGLHPDETIELSAIGLRERGNLIELDGYPTGIGRIAGPRPRASGQLPPGNAMVSFEVEELGRYKSLAIAPPQTLTGAEYQGRRTCTLRGPAGELVELIERH